MNPRLRLRTLLSLLLIAFLGIGVAVQVMHGEVTGGVGDSQSEPCPPGTSTDSTSTGVVCVSASNGTCKITIASPGLAPVGNTATVTLTVDNGPEGGSFSLTADPSLNITGAGGTYSISSSETGKYTLTGSYNYTVDGVDDACTVTTTIELIGVDDVLKEGASVGADFTVLNGTATNLEARPDGSAFPADQPVWTLTASNPAKTLTGTPTGAIFAIPDDIIDTTGTYTFTATCGTASSDSITVTVNPYQVTLNVSNSIASSNDRYSIDTGTSDIEITITPALPALAQVHLDFGDGTDETTSATTLTHVFPALDTYTVTPSLVLEDGTTFVGTPITITLDYSAIYPYQFNLSDISEVEQWTTDRLARLVPLEGVNATEADLIQNEVLLTSNDELIDIVPSDWLDAPSGPESDLPPGAFEPMMYYQSHEGMAISAITSAAQSPGTTKATPTVPAKFESLVPSNSTPIVANSAVTSAPTGMAEGNEIHGLKGAVNEYARMGNRILDILRASKEASEQNSGELRAAVNSWNTAKSQLAIAYNNFDAAVSAFHASDDSTVNRAKVHALFQSLLELNEKTSDMLVASRNALEILQRLTKVPNMPQEVSDSLRVLQTVTEELEAFRAQMFEILDFGSVIKGGLEKVKESGNKLLVEKWLYQLAPVMDAHVFDNVDEPTWWDNSAMGVYVVGKPFMSYSAEQRTEIATMFAREDQGKILPNGNAAITNAAVKTAFIVVYQWGRIGLESAASVFGGGIDKIDGALDKVEMIYDLQGKLRPQQ